MKTRTLLKRILFVLILFSSCSIEIFSKVKLPVVISDGMVLQRNRPLKIWGTADAGETVKIKFKKKTYETLADNKGAWEIELPAMKAGGPYSMQVNDIVVNNILIGDVFLCSGQSNMELPVRRVMDKYADEVNGYENNNVRFLTVPYCYDFNNEADDIKNTSWKPMTKDNVSEFSAICYFFSRLLEEKTDVPVGIVNSSWGGTPVESWISEEGLSDFPVYVNRKSMYENTALVEEIKKVDGMRQHAWNVILHKSDAGLQEVKPWYAADYDDSSWNTVDMFSPDWGIQNGRPINGSHWFRKEFDVPESWSGKDVVLRLGCIVDADSVYVNGNFVGTVSYQYPPRIYNVPSEFIKSGKNQITVRLISYGGYPSFVKDKPYKLICGNEEVNLQGEWKHKIGTTMPSVPSSTSFHYEPVVLYNGMIHPFENYEFNGVVWYQGESNVGRWNEYSSLLSAMITDWRSLFDDDDLPFYIIELADFLAPENPGRKAWAELRKQQAMTAEKNSNTVLIKNSDTGEWNDIHPLDKKTAAKRLVEAVLERSCK